MRLASALTLTLACLASCKEPAPVQPQAAPLPTAAARASGGPPIREIAVTEKGFEPDSVQVAPSQPVVLRFTRRVQETCADAVDVQGDPVRHMLPLGAAIDVKVTAPASGEIAFACPMRMYKGRALVVAGH